MIDNESPLLKSVETVDLRLDEGVHPIEARHQNSIEANWQEETARNATLFDGKTVLLTNLEVRDKQLVARCRIARFATFVFCRRNGLERSAVIYANAIPVTTDNALVAIEMSAYTFNGGMVYFASGGFEEGDMAGTRVDVHRNMCREVLEETGLSLDKMERDKQYRVATVENGTVVAARFQLDMTADEVERRIDAHIHANPNCEIARPVIIRNRTHSERRFGFQMPLLIDWHFSNPLGFRSRKSRRASSELR